MKAAYSLLLVIDEPQPKAVSFN